jgi:surface antigen
MKNLLRGMVGAILVAGLVGCQTPEGRTDRTATGALTGGALGAGTGAIIGSMKGQAGAGAAIGGILGAVAGGAIGHGMDSTERDIERRAQARAAVPPMAQGQPLGIADIKSLSKAGISDEVMISHIRNSRTVYRLTTAEIIDLKDAGVSQKVIDFMINTQSLYPPAVLPPRY